MTRRAAIYARFSSDRQNDKSCDDQINLCANWAERQAIAIVGSFKDEAVSGASTHNRPGLEQLLRAARLARFDTLICEDLDRVSRKQADLHRIRDELSFFGISIMTVSDGMITAMHAGLKGLMSEMFLVDLANKTRRGLGARVASGASGGGKSYGYDPIPGQPGEMTINAREADIVRRIFAEYLDGASPREIVARLNAEGIPGPRGGNWNSSTINGSKARANGVLQNRLYVGEIVWNRQRFIKDPSTGKRVSRLNPENEWLRVPAPHLAIVEPEAFARAQARKIDRTHARETPVPARPKHLLSGLTKCGCCGASYTIIGRDRLGCAGFRERGDCTNGRSVERKHIEARVLATLRDNLVAPETLSRFIKTFHEKLRQRIEAQRKDRRPLEKRLAELTRGIDRIVDQVVEGTASPALMQRLTAMEAEKAELTQQLAEVDGEEIPFTLHPGAADMYRRTVEDLQRLLDAEDRQALIERLRPLIDRVVITPPANSKTPVDLVIHGRLAELLATPGSEPQYRGTLVAGARNKRRPTFILAA